MRRESPGLHSKVTGGKVLDYTRRSRGVLRVVTVQRYLYYYLRSGEVRQGVSSPPRNIALGTVEGGIDELAVPFQNDENQNKVARGRRTQGGARHTH